MSQGLRKVISKQIDINKYTVKTAQNRQSKRKTQKCWKNWGKYDLSERQVYNKQNRTDKTDTTQIGERINWKHRYNASGSVNKNNRK